MKNKLFCFVILFVCTALLLSACGRGRNDNETQQEPEAAPRTAGATGVGYGTPSLTISASWFTSRWLIEQTVEALQQSLAGNQLHVEIINYPPAEAESHYQVMLSRLAAGIGPDIFIWGINPPFYRFVENGFLADIYTIIDQSPASREDFFTNVLQAFEFDGQLLAFPTRFSFEYIGINENVPQAVLDRFAALDRATPSGLMAIYSDLVSNYPEWEEFAFLFGGWASLFYGLEVSAAVDFVNRSVNFPNSTAEMLENIRFAFYENNRFNTDHVFPATDDFMAILQERYVFKRVSGGHNKIEAMFNFETPFFVNYVPLANEAGRLTHDGFMGSISVSQHANPYLAWAFIDELMLQSINDGIHNPSIPITRQYFAQAVEEGFNNALEFNRPRPFIGGQGYAIAAALMRLEAYKNLPTASIFSTQYMRFPVHGTIDGLTGAEALLQLEQSIIEWMNTERPIEEYVPEPEPDLSHLTVRNLTVNTRHDQAGVIRQAAIAMNDSWRAQGSPYLLQVEVETYNWMTPGAVEARNTRLGVEFMGGSGPDIFLLDLREPGLNIHSLMASGFIVDINNLIDSHPRTGREDFFTAPLAAIETLGGLYAFPINFGPRYIAINMDLPQSIINRFSQYSGITYSQMIEIYLELMDNYGGEFGHMAFVFGAHHPRLAIESIMGNFIDFNSRTANLTDPRFIYFLDDFARMRDIGHDGRVMFQGAGGMNLIPPEWFREVGGDSFVFFALGSNLSAGEAYLTIVDPAFCHHIPLVDKDGRISLSFHAADTVAVYCIAAAGDYSLAWEFMQYVIDMYIHPVGLAIGATGDAFLGPGFLSSPIRRDLFDDHVLQAFNNMLRLEPYWLEGYWDSEVVDGPTGWELQVNLGAQLQQEIEAGIDRIAQLNEMPMSLRFPMIPPDMFEEDFDLFWRGLLTAQDFATRLHNRITLWLIE